jgi:rare lipoprotein A
MNGRTLLLLTALFLFADIAHARTPATDGAAGATANAATRGAAPSLAAKVRKAVQRGKVSWYGPGFAGRKTASGERFDPHAMTMAHRTLPLGAIVEVTNDANGKRVRLRVNDRGPFCRGRVADVSRAASKRLGFVDKGVTQATLRVVSLPEDAPGKVASDSAGRSDADRPG